MSGGGQGLGLGLGFWFEVVLSGCTRDMCLTYPNLGNIDPQVDAFFLENPS